MPIPVDPSVADLVALLDADSREAFEERAAIMEFDAGLTRAHAECRALLDLLLRPPSIVFGAAVLRFQIDGAIGHVLAADVRAAHRHLSDLGATEITVMSVATFLDRHCRGLAHLAPL